MSDLISATPWQRCWRRVASVPVPAAALAAMLTVMVLAGQPAPAAGQQMEPTIVAIIDTPLILRQSKAGAEVARQIEGFGQEAQRDIAAQEQALRDEEEKLASQQGVLSREAFQREAQAFQQRVADMQREVQQRKSAIDQSMLQGNQQIFRAIEEILSELARERGFHLVLERTQVAAIVNRRMELTEEVQRRLDERLPSVSVPPPQVSR